MLSLKLQSVLSKYKTLNNTNASVNKEQPKKKKKKTYIKKKMKFQQQIQI